MLNKISQLFDELEAELNGEIVDAVDVLIEHVNDPDYDTQVGAVAIGKIHGLLRAKTILGESVPAVIRLLILNDAEQEALKVNKKYLSATCYTAVDNETIKTLKFRFPRLNVQTERPTVEEKKTLGIDEIIPLT